MGRSGKETNGHPLHTCALSQHFEPACCMADCMLSQSLGLGTKRACLKPDAIPTVFTKPVSGKRKAEVNNSLPQKRSAYKKNEYYGVSLNEHVFNHSFKPV